MILNYTVVLCSIESSALEPESTEQRIVLLVLCLWIKRNNDGLVMTGALRVDQLTL